MLPTVVAREVMDAVRLQLQAQFPSTTSGFLRQDALSQARVAIDDLLDEPNQVFRGPYLSMSLPFQSAGADEPLPFQHLKLNNIPYLHQMKAFSRLCGGVAQPTLVATGTGSGKTECFLYPLLEHCAEVQAPGIKALIIYPMNALAKDQARRFAEEINEQSKINGKVRVGLYTGEASRGERNMSAAGVITDRRTLQDNPPDILLTNYKMLDFLMFRPADRELWRYNTPGMLRYLVVDELHTFDGAQGSDLACLIRRLRDRLDCGEELACIGTSATVGDDAKALLDYASKVFATPFGEDAVLREERQALSTFLQEDVSSRWPDRDNVMEFSKTKSFEVTDYLQAASQLWLDKKLPDVEELGNELKQLAPFRNLLAEAVQVTELTTVIDEHAQLWRVTDREAADAIDALVALACTARSNGRPWLTIRVQLWLRELRRMVASVNEKPQLHFHADLDDETVEEDAESDRKTIALPVIYCNDCHATGWLAREPGNSAKLVREPRSIYDSFFSGSPDAVAIYPIASPPATRAFRERQLCTHCGTLSRPPKMVESSVQDADCTNCGVRNAVFLDVLLPEMTREVERQGVRMVKFQRDCPYCESEASLLILGARAASLSSVAISKLQQSPFNGDEKLIAFSDSVQDAAHRAGFFQARTYRSVIRQALTTAIEQTKPVNLTELIEQFGLFWQKELAEQPDGKKQSPDANFVATFLAPDQYWREDWETLKTTDKLSVDSNIVSNYVLPRLRWEALVAFGFESRRGRTLERMEIAIAQVDRTRIDETIDWALPRITGQLAELASLDEITLRQMILGILWTLRTRGGFYQDTLERFIHSSGRPYELTNSRLQTELKPMGRRSRIPHFVSMQYVGPHADAVVSSRSMSWYRNWFDKLAGQDDVMASAVLAPFHHLLFEGMEKAGLLNSHPLRQHTIWSLNTDAWMVSTDVVTLVCNQCRNRLQVAASEVSDWDSMPCIRPSCDGSHSSASVLAEKPTQNTRDKPIVRPVRLNAAEHTAVLDTDTRNHTEKSFKRKPAQTWDINLLSATPTMEMGVDIGALSSVLLCSVPPAQANYLQRIGRAGRTDGNAFNLTIANGHPHDLYHFSEPLEMMRGAVQPPGVFLSAIAVLKRQLVAFCFDRWVQTGIDENAIQPQLRKVLDAVKEGSSTAFPNNFLDFVHNEKGRLSRDFLNIFDGHITSDGEDELLDFLRGAYNEKGGTPGIVRRLRDLFEDQLTQRQNFEREIKKLRGDLDRISKQPVDEAQKTAEAETASELAALRNLLSRLNRQNTLQFLTDQGVLPNYAFPEDGVTLKSVIYRRNTSADEGDGTRYKTIELEVRRPAQVALKELAPFNRFYGNTRSVQIDQVTIGRHDIELWRLCPSCNHGEMIALGDSDDVCPNCKNPGWRASEQRMELMRLREVHARASDSESRIGDDADDRDPTFFNRQLLFDVKRENILRGWRFTDEQCPFGFELLNRATFREMNFGRAVDGGQAIRVAGNSFNRPGFPICSDCGKVDVQQRRGQSKHARRCKWFAHDGEPEEQNAWKHLHLYRELQSEAVRLLLPIADIARSSMRLESLKAALYLGLREHFRGNVDHLKIEAINEPVSGTDLRRYYLVLFDGVPGGTGYLADLLKVPENLRHMLEKAYNILAKCACQHDGKSDGCYRCLLAYRSSLQMDDIKRSSAMETLELILGKWDSLEEMSKEDSLEFTKVNRLFDSELERRFIDVLGGSPGCSIERREINGNDGFELTIRQAGRSDEQRPSVRWSIEPQVDFGESDGIALECRPDFIFRCLTTRVGDIRPIAVFTDGFEHHADILASDTAKRYAIMRSRGYRVWTLGWYDMPELDKQREFELDEWFSQPRDRTMTDKVFDPAAKAFGVDTFANQPLETRSAVFNQWLFMLADPVAAVSAYTNWAFSRAFGLLDGQTVRDPAPVRQRVGTWIPAPWQDEFLNDESVIGHRVLTDNPLVDVVVTLPKTALAQLGESARAARSGSVGTQDPASAIVRSGIVDLAADAGGLAGLPPTNLHPMAKVELSMVLRLDDSVTSGDEFKQQWRRFWASVNLFQYLPELMPVMRSGIEEQVYAGVIEDSLVMTPTVSMVDDVLIDAEWQDMISFTNEPVALARLSQRGIKPPDEVGIDVEQDEEVLAEVEWRWLEQRVALCLSENEEDLVRLSKHNWQVITDVESESLDKLVNWLLGEHAK